MTQMALHGSGVNYVLTGPEPVGFSLLTFNKVKVLLTQRHVTELSGHSKS